MLTTFGCLLSSMEKGSFDPAMHKAQFQCGINSPSGQSEAPGDRMAGCPPVRQGWELRWGAWVERLQAPEGSGCRRDPDRDARAGAPDWVHRAADSETVYRTFPASFSCSAPAGAFMASCMAS